MTVRPRPKSKARPTKPAKRKRGRRWLQHLPGWIEASPEYASLRLSERVLLDVIAGRCDLKDGSLVNCWGGPKLIAASGSRRSTFWTNTDHLRGLGFLAKTEQGGGHKADRWGIPGEPGALLDAGDDPRYRQRTPDGTPPPAVQDLDGSRPKLGRLPVRNLDGSRPKLGPTHPPPPSPKTISPPIREAAATNGSPPKKPKPKRTRTGGDRKIPSRGGGGGAGSAGGGGEITEADLDEIRERLRDRPDQDLIVAVLAKYGGLNEGAARRLVEKQAPTAAIVAQAFKDLAEAQRTGEVKKPAGWITTRIRDLAKEAREKRTSQALAVEDDERTEREEVLAGIHDGTTPDDEILANRRGSFADMSVDQIRGDLVFAKEVAQLIVLNRERKVPA